METEEDSFGSYLVRIYGVWSDKISRCSDIIVFIDRVSSGKDLAIISQLTECCYSMYDVETMELSRVVRILSGILGWLGEP